jgi:predicted kinase
MGKLIVGVGIPGSGKTAIFKKFAAKHEYSYICPDDIREELTGDASDQSQNAAVWNKAKERLQEFLKENKTVVFDATFADPEQRKEFLTFAGENGAVNIQGVYVSVSLEIAKERNQKRERKVPEHVLERMKNEFQNSPPSTTDGFDSLFTLDENGELSAAEKIGEENMLYREFSKKIS